MTNKNNLSTNCAESADSHSENLQDRENVDNFAPGERLYINPMTDFGFKKIFSHENVMKAFLNDLLLPSSPIEHIEFRNNDMLPQNKEERGVVYDLRCTTEDGKDFIVEMQNRSQTYFSDRIVYYLSRSIAPQGDKGNARGNKWDYKLKPVYGVFFLNFHLDNLQERMIRTIRYIVEETREIFNDKVRAYTIELPGIKDTKEEDCQTNIERWIYNLFNMENMTKPLSFQDIMPVFKEVATAAEIAKMDTDEYTRYMDSLDSYRTTLAAFDYEREKGKKEGILQVAKDMKEYGTPFDFIAKVTGLSIDEIEKL